MSKYFQGQEVNILIDGTAVAKSTSCSLTLSANTTDASSKDDTDAFFDSPEVTYITWEVSNESFVTTVSDLKTLINAWLGRSTVTVNVQDLTVDDAIKSGSAYLTSVEVTATNGDYATVSLSFTGDGALS